MTVKELRELLRVGKLALKGERREEGWCSKEKANREPGGWVTEDT